MTDNIGRVAFLSSKIFHITMFSACVLTLLGLEILYSSSCFIYFFFFPIFISLGVYLLDYSIKCLRVRWDN